MRLEEHPGLHVYHAVVLQTESICYVHLRGRRTRQRPQGLRSPSLQGRVRPTMTLPEKPAPSLQKPFEGWRVISPPCLQFRPGWCAVRHEEHLHRLSTIKLNLEGLSLCRQRKDPVLRRRSPALSSRRVCDVTLSVSCPAELKVGG